MVWFIVGGICGVLGTLVIASIYKVGSDADDQTKVRDIYRQGSEATKPDQQKTEILVAGRFIRVNLPTETNKPNPFLAEPGETKPQQLG